MKNSVFLFLSVSQQVNTMLSRTPLRFLLEVPLHSWAAEPAAGKDHCCHPQGQEETLQAAANALLLKTLSPESGIATGYQLITNLLPKANLLRKL